MDRMTVLVTGAGAPGIRGTIYSIKNNWEDRKITIIGVDMNDDIIGKYLCDKTYRVPPAKDERFISALLDICKDEKVDVLLPQVTNELSPISLHKKLFEEGRTKVALSDYSTIEIANNKRSLLDIAKRLYGMCPEFQAVSSWDQLLAASGKLGFPFVVKPPVSNGMRGFRVVYEKLDQKKSFFEEKPDSSSITLDELYHVLGEQFPDLLAMEYLPGDEYSVDILSSKDRTLAAIPRRRDQIRSGITFKGSVQKRDDIIGHVELITHRLGLEFAHGLQYKEDADGNPKLIESNPRVQGTMVLSTIAGANIIYGAIKMALDEPVPEFSIRWDARLLRYWGGVGVGGSVVDI